MTTTGSPYFIWETKDKAVSILLDLDLVTHLDRAVVEAFFRSRQEVEGLLIGHMEQTPGRGKTVFIDAFELQERGALRLRPTAHPGVVGGFRSTGGKQGLTDADQDIIQGCAPDSTFVFLQMRPSYTALTMANFFVVEKGSAIAHDGSQEFPLSREHLEFGNYHRAAPVATRRPAPHWLWIPAVLLGAIIFSVVSQRMSSDVSLTPSAEVSQPAAALQLKAERTNGRQFRISWDGNSPVIAGAERGVLCITDAGAEQRIDLNRQQLANANAVYTSTGSDNLLVRLDVFGVANVISESFRFSPPVVGPPPPIAEPTPANTTQPPVVVAKAKPTTPAPLKTAAPLNAIPQSTPEPQPSSSAPLAAAIPALAPVLVASKPREIAAAPIPLPSVAAPVATVSLEEVSENRFKKAFHVIPGLRKLDKRHDADYVAPVAAHQAIPTLPPSVRHELTNDVIVAVRASIDGDGNVSRVELVTGEVDNRLAEAALTAARQWRFQPALIDAKPTPSKMVLRFRFHGSSTVNREGPKIADRFPVSNSQIGQ